MGLFSQEADQTVRVNEVSDLKRLSVKRALIVSLNFSKSKNFTNTNISFAGFDEKIEVCPRQSMQTLIKCLWKLPVRKRELKLAQYRPIARRRDFISAARILGNP